MHSTYNIKAKPALERTHHVYVRSDAQCSNLIISV